MTGDRSPLGWLVCVEAGQVEHTRHPWGGSVGERVAQMLGRERRESDVLSDGVRDC